MNHTKIIEENMDSLTDSIYLHPNLWGQLVRENILSTEIAADIKVLDYQSIGNLLVNRSSPFIFKWSIF